jgi:hypothetical protein
MRHVFKPGDIVRLSTPRYAGKGRILEVFETGDFVPNVNENVRTTKGKPGARVLHLDVPNPRDSDDYNGVTGIYTSQLVLVKAAK